MTFLTKISNFGLKTKILLVFIVYIDLKGIKIVLLPNKIWLYIYFFIDDVFTQDTCVECYFVVSESQLQFSCFNTSDTFTAHNQSSG